MSSKNSKKTNTESVPNTNLPNKAINLKDLICSFGIDLSNLNQIKLLFKSPQFVRTFILSTFPRFLNFGDFINPLCSFGNINTSIFVKPLVKSLAQTNLTELINEYEDERTNALKQNNAAKANAFMQKKLESEALRDEISTDFNRLFEITVLSTVFANSEENLSTLSEYFGHEMSKSVSNLKSAWAYQDEAFTSNTPIGDNKTNIINISDTFATSALFPFLASDINHPTGIPYVVHLKTNIPILIDSFYQALPNYNCVILGETNTGKNLSGKLLALRTSALDGVKNIIIDSNGSYSKISEFLGGTTYKLEAASNLIVNPFDVEPEEIKDDITGRRRTFINIENKIKDVTTILMTMARGSIKSNYPNDVMAKIVFETVSEEYRVLGIDSNPDNLYGSTGANLIGTKISRTKKEMPTISSWYKRLCQKASLNTNPENKYYFEYLMKYMTYYLREENGKIPYFDGQTTIDIPDNTICMNFDISDLEENFTKPLMQQILLSFINEKFVKSNLEDKYKAEKRRIFIEDAYLLASYPEAGYLLSMMFDRCINRNVSFALISERFSDFLINEKLTNAMSNASIKLLMKQSEADLKNIKSCFNLTDGELNFIGNCLKNEGILKIESNSAEVIVAHNGYEYEIFETR